MVPVCFVFPQEAGESPEEGRTPIAMVLTAEGRAFSVFAGGELSVFDPHVESMSGLPLRSDTLVQLEEATSLELQLLPGTTRLKLAAHSSMRVVALRPGGAGELSLSYGRFRIVVPASTANYVGGGEEGDGGGEAETNNGGGAGGDDWLILNTPDARVSIATGSDVAVDVLVNSETGDPYTAVSTIAGSARITVRSADTGGDAETGTGAADDEDEASGESREVPPATHVHTNTPDAEGRLVSVSGFPADLESFWTPRAFESAAHDKNVLEERYEEAFAYVSGFYEDESAALAQADRRREDDEPEARTEETEGGEEAREGEAERREEPQDEPADPSEAVSAEEDGGDDKRIELRNGGVGLMGLGTVFAAAGFGVDSAADAFVTTDAQPRGVPPAEALLYAGGAFFVSGLITFIISQF